MHRAPVFCYAKKFFRRKAYGYKGLADFGLVDICTENGIGLAFGLFKVYNVAAKVFRYAKNYIETRNN